MAGRQAFRDNPELQQFVLPEARPTGRQLGVGSYGSVEELQVKGLVCAGKRMHEALLQRDNEGVINIERKYLEECQVMTKLRHPHIVQFLGLCYLEGSTLPVLVMERMDSSLDDLLEGAPGLPLALKRSLLTDVVRGLLCLHTRDPPIVHRDLSSRNVLLTSSLTAKISDLGNARIVPDQLARAFTRMPGTMVYMPPEASHEGSRYGSPLDIFSYGHLALFTLTQIFPGSLLPSTYADPESHNRLLARSELERRSDYIQPLHRQLGEEHPLVQLVHQCLHNDPAQRPSAEELLQQLDETRGRIEQPYGSYRFKVQLAMMSAVEMEMGEKDREVEHLQQELHQLQENRQRLQVAMDTQLQQKDAQLQQQGTELQEMTTEINRQQGELQTLREDKGRLQQAQVEINRQQGELQALREEKGRLQQQAEGKDAEINRQQRELQTLTDNRQRLQVAMDTQLRQKDAQLQQQGTELQEKKTEINRQQGELQTLREDKRRLQQQAEGKDAEINRKQRELQTLTEDKGRLQQQAEGKDAEINRQQRELQALRQHNIHLGEFVKKQQLDYEEALGSLKKISHTNQFVDENLKLHQLNVNLTAELEDYRTQTKRLLADLQQKDATLAENGAEVDQLRQQGAYHSSSSSDRDKMEELQHVRETSESITEQLQNQLSQYDRQVNALATKAQDRESRLHRYREERNQAQAANQAFQDEISMLNQTVQILRDELQSKDQYLNSGENRVLKIDSTDYSSHTQHTQSREPSMSPSRYNETTSPTRDQPTYSPNKYASSDDQFREDMVSPTVRSTSSQRGDSRKFQGRSQSVSSSTSSLDSSRRESGEPKSQRHSSGQLAEVRTKEGTKSTYIQKPVVPLSAKDKPHVIIKSSEGVFEAGTVMYIGMINQKEMAGVQLDIRMPRSSSSSMVWPISSDGTCEADGRRYFKCPLGYGVYVHLSKIYVEEHMESFTV